MSNLLPPNSKPLEKTLAGMTQRLENIAVPFETIWDADRCPTSCLPFLAYAWSVDEWNDNWPESVQREVIKQSLVIHQRKGTIGAVKRALSAMRYETKVTEWFDKTPRGTPGTFSIEVRPSDGVVSDTLDQIKAVIDQVKRLSAHYDIFFGSSINAAPVITCAVLVGVEVTISN